MCCFSPVAATGSLWRRLFGGPRVQVGKTRIFARVQDGMQYLVYSMSLSTPGDVAMILPIPIADQREDALELLDLSGYPGLFDDLARMFAVTVMPASRGRFSSAAGPPRAPLPVHQVGAYDASFVPTIGDFDRLDPRFRVPAEVWAARPGYASYGFAVFKLRKARRQTIHPMAMRFRTSEPGAIFFPTLHVHDGALHDSATFDHTLYYQLPSGAAGTCQRPGDPAPGASQASLQRAGAGIDATRALGIVDAGEIAYQWQLHGKRSNDDTWVRIEAAPGARAAA